MEKERYAIKITGKALDYLKRKGKTAVTIGFSDYRTNGDFAVIPIPEIFAKKPKSEEKYVRTEVEKIEVYISRMVDMPKDEDVVIDVTSFLKMQFLTLTGFRIEK
ncbi:MAG TPA: hypothetical protein DEF04_08030 [Clostridiales bacterium]|nr:hypothetical protein [Clostridiales bacterium]